MARVNETAAMRNSLARQVLAERADRANRRRAWPRWASPALRVALVVSVLGGIGGTGFWLWRSGLAEGVYNGVTGTLVQGTALLGFRIQEVLVEGRSGAEKPELLAALGVKRGDPILGFSLTQAKDALEHIPWIASATIERRLPDIVFIRLIEREPMALWQCDQRLVLIDKVGTVLADQGVERFTWMPIIVGKGAPEHAPALLAQLANEPELSTHLAAAVWIGGRRWDLRLDNGINVRLPEYDYPGALRWLAEVAQRDSLLDRDIVAIDLRMPDRLILQSSESVTIRKKSADEKI